MQAVREEMTQLRQLASDFVKESAAHEAEKESLRLSVQKEMDAARAHVREAERRDAELVVWFLFRVSLVM